MALRHPDDLRPPTYPQRIMTYMALAESTTLTPQEAPAYAQLGQTPGGVGSGASVGVLAANPAPVQASELLAYVLGAGQHGLALQPLEHLDDEALLRLRLLLEPALQIEQPLLQRLSVPLRINALVALAELGREQAQAYVRGYLLRQAHSSNLDVRRYGLWALGRGQLRHPHPATRDFLRQAVEPAFWCAAGQATSADCQALAQAARKAASDAGLKALEPRPGPAIRPEAAPPRPQTLPRQAGDPGR